MLLDSNHLGCRRGLVSIGRLETGDRKAVREVFDGLSERSRRLRFHGPKPRRLERDLDELVQVGCCGREAVAAVDLVSGEIVGIARFVRSESDPRSAEVAFEVVDRCQGSGVGRRLLDELRSLALDEGIARFSASVVRATSRRSRCCAERDESSSRHMSKARTSSWSSSSRFRKPRSRTPTPSLRMFATCESSRARGRVTESRRRPER